MGDETVNQTWVQKGSSTKANAMPGVVLVWSGGRARLDPIPVEREGLELGRGVVSGVEIDDNTMSRKHARVSLDVSSGQETWVLEDLNSRNGSAVDGAILVGQQKSDVARVLRCGDSLFLLLRDVRPFLRAQVRVVDGLIVGPRLGAAWQQIERAASSGEVLHITGETGAGKELAARRFHQAGPRAKGPFVAVNCATIPPNLAERVLFGAKKGAYSGADSDVDGYVQAAHNGTLFLDELAELDLQVQAKLLRVLETREVTQLGATTSKKVNISVVSATHSGLRDRVDEGRFRADLFFRLGRPQVALPSLRDRAEDIPFILEETLKPLGQRAHVSLVETALVREWPGNVRELLLEIKDAASAAAVAHAERVEAEHLNADAGKRRLSPPAATALAALTSAAGPTKARAANVEVPPKEVIVRALEENGGNVSRTSRALGVHRNQLRRWMQKYELASDKRDDDEE